MGKKRGRDNEKQRKVNPNPFLADEHPAATSKSRSKTPKLHQQHAEAISQSMSGKILREAFKQQREVEDEDNLERNPTAAAFNSLEEEVPTILEDKENDVDDYVGLTDPQRRVDEDYKVNEEDERLLDAFLSKDAGPQKTLGDVIAARIKAQDATLTEMKPTPKLDDKLIQHYKSIGKVLSVYTSGKLPKSFKHIPAMECWEEVLYLTEPEKWSPGAVFQATRIFASNMNRKKAERFYLLVLLPRVREDIRKHKRLHFELYQALKKSLYKPAAFNKGILLPLFKSGNCNLREAVIVGSIIQKMSIPQHHASVVLMKLAEMDYCGTTSYIIKILIEKKYSMPYRVIDALVAHFMRFLEDPRTMPVIWHQTLLAFAIRCKHELLKEDKERLHNLMQIQRHYLVTPDIIREFTGSRIRGEKEDNMLITSPISVLNKPIEEDRFDIPEVPMEEDD
ncbi:bystin [Silene latifolia]|uniref:bystin n=1 Tax=Silene latifolia TaxID=37657 RepID=UPI003D7851B3